MSLRHFKFLKVFQIILVTCLVFATSMAFAEKPTRKSFGKGKAFTVEELPAGKLKEKLQALNPQARGKAMKWLHEFNFEDSDAAPSRGQ